MISNYSPLSNPPASGGGGGGGSGTVTNVAVSTANGLAGTVATSTTTPVITLSTTATGILKGDGTAISAAVAGDFPTLNQNTTGTASNVTGVVAIANGGTGQTTAANAINALVPSQTGNNGKVLTTDGTVVSWQTSAGSGTVTSVGITAGSSKISSSGGPITSSGSITVDVVESNLTLSNMGGSLALGSQVTGTLPVANGGTGATTLTGVVKGNGTSAFTAGTVALGSEVSGTLPIANGGTGQTSANNALNALLPAQGSNSGKFLTTDGTNTSWATVSGGSGTVTSASVVTANGFAGTVATATTTPAITLTTSVTGMIKGNGTALSAATGGTDYSEGTSALATGILKSTTGTGALSIAVAGDFPTLNQNTTGTASNVTGVVTITHGGTGQTTANDSFNALAPSQTSNSGKFLTTDGTNTSWAAATTAPAGSNTEIQFNNLGSFGASANLTFASNVLSVGAGGTSGTLSLHSDANHSPTQFLSNGTYTEWSAGDGIGQAGLNVVINGGGGASNFDGGDIQIVGGNGAGTGLGGSINIEAGADGGGTSGGSVTLSTFGMDFGINNAGAITLNGAAGTSGQVLTSQGSGSPAQWTTVGGSGTVTSVGVSSNGTYANAITVGSSPVTSSGTITLTPNVFTSTDPGVAPASGGGTTNFLRADGSWAAPTGSGTVTSVNVSGGTTGLTFSGGPVTSSGTITMAGTLDEVNGGTGQTTFTTGDILYASASNTLSKLAAGTNGHVLTLAAGIPSWAAASGGGTSYTLEPVRVATTANGTLASAFENGDTIDGVTLVTGNRILIKNQTTATENGVYVVQASGAPVRASDFTTGAATLTGGAVIPVIAGNLGSGTQWQCSNNSAITIGSTSITFIKQGTRGYVDVGYSASSPVNSATASTTGIAVGYNSQGTGSSAISIGYGAQATGTGSISIGSSATLTTNTNAISIGYGNAGFDNSLLLNMTSFANPGTDFAGHVKLATGNWTSMTGADLASRLIGVNFLSGWTTTTNATATEIGVAGGSNTPTTRIALVNNSTYIFDCDIVARQSATGTDYSAWNLKFCINREANAASTALVGSATKTVIGQTAGASAWDVSVTADTTNGRPNISVTGAASTTIRWAATIRMTKVSG